MSRSCGFFEAQIVAYEGLFAKNTELSPRGESKLCPLLRLDNESFQ